MKKTIVLLTLAILAIGAKAQSCYWVMLTDKAGTSFDPYSYFDAKAIERYQLNRADLYDISNYPLNESYVSQIDALATDDFGQSRWLNAVAVTATPDQIAAIQKLPFVREVVLLGGDMQPAAAENSYNEHTADMLENIGNTLSDQVIRMGGKHFRDKGINGKGVRIAVFDGGFPQVNTHIAFKHLRDEGRIIKTWNFPNKKEDVYGWNSHGLMTLSCIAGIHRYEGTDGEVLCDDGLATGAEFLLARTEVNTEPFKEEVWWMMAVEWADKNGAQIISSSLGYGKDRYYTKDMNGQSYVAKAGNMAARKGILVCNSAGNEGSDRTWRTIITPADADSVLCVGGIANSLEDYSQIYFSSYGPTADGRQKPNVVAFGNAHTAATGGVNKYNYNYHYVDGTSFSCPLVAGFAACALQAHPNLTAMQLFHEIERSADLYPYCDYSYGYGVPQADYFTGDRKEVQPTFRFERKDDNVKVIPLVESKERCYIFVKNSRPDGTIINYSKTALKTFSKEMSIEIISPATITVFYKGYVENCTINPQSEEEMRVYVYDSAQNPVNVYNNYESHFSKYLDEKHFRWEPYLMLGLPINTASEELDHSIWSPAKRIGIRRTHLFTKGYGWGFALEYGNTSYRMGNDVNRLDSLAGMDDEVLGLDKNVTKHRVNLGEVGIEIYQRVRLLPAGLLHKGLHWDLGVYGNWGFNAYRLKGSRNGDIASSRYSIVRNIDPLSDYRWNWGVTTRFTFDVIGIYGRYRLNGIGNDVAAGKVLLPRLEVGLQLSF